MTTFTTSDRENAKLVEEAPYHPGYEDAVVYPTVIVDSGASVDDREDSMQMLRDQIHTQQCEINALRKALMYTHPVKEPMMVLDGNPVYPAFKELTDEEILEICDLGEWHKDEFAINFARAILRKAQEK